MGHIWRSPQLFVCTLRHVADDEAMARWTFYTLFRVMSQNGPIVRVPPLLTTHEEYPDPIGGARPELVHPGQARFIPGVNDLMKLAPPDFMLNIIDQTLGDLVRWIERRGYPMPVDSIDRDAVYQNQMKTDALALRVRTLLARMAAGPGLRRTVLNGALNKILSLLGSTRGLAD